MDFNTKEYEVSILKKIDEGFAETIEKVVHYNKIKNEDKTPEELLEELSCKERLSALKQMKAELIRESNINYGTNKEYKNKEEQEVKCLLKMASDHEIAIDDYKRANNTTLYNYKKAVLEVIREYAPS